MRDLLTIEDIGPGYETEPIDIITSEIIAEQKRGNGMGLMIPEVDMEIYVEILGNIKDAIDHISQYAYGCSGLDFHGWADGGWWRGLLTLVDDCHPIFKDIVVNAADTGGKRLVPVDEVWYDTSDEEVMD